MSGPEDAHRLKYFRRYRDDCTSINVNNFFDIARDIYPPSLDLTRENDRDDEANVLDMEVKLMNRNIITKVYCKTDAFPFHVISLPFLESNLDNKICYRVFYGQVIRYQRLCSFMSGFEERTKFLLDVLLKRGYDVDRLRCQFCKAVERYILEFQRWVIPLDFNHWFNCIKLSTFSNDSLSQSGSI